MFRENKSQRTPSSDAIIYLIGNGNVSVFFGLHQAVFLSIIDDVIPFVSEDSVRLVFFSLFVGTIVPSFLAAPRRVRCAGDFFYKHTDV